METRAQVCAKSLRLVRLEKRKLRLILFTIILIDRFSLSLSLSHTRTLRITRR